MYLICAVRVAEGWTAANVVAGLLLLAAVLAGIVWAVRVTLRR